MGHQGSVGQVLAGCQEVQRAEISEAVETGAEEAGVDGAGDGRARGDDGDDGDTEHVGHVIRAEGAAGLGHEDHPVAGHAHGERRGKGDVARASQHQVPLAVPADRLSARRCPARVDDHDTGDRDLSAVVGGEEQLRSDLDRCRTVRGGDTEDRRCRNRLRRHQDRVLVSGGEEGQCSCDRRGPLPAARADQGDRAGHRAPPELGGVLERFRCRDGEVPVGTVSLISEMERFRWAAAGLPRPDRRATGGHRHGTRPVLELAGHDPAARTGAIWEVWRSSVTPPAWSAW